MAPVLLGCRIAVMKRKPLDRNKMSENRCIQGKNKAWQADSAMIRKACWLAQGPEQNMVAVS